VSRIALFGGSGKLGRKLIDRALEHGYRVNALARDPARVHRHADDLTVIQGDAETGAGIGATVRGCRWIVFAISSTKPTIAQCTANLVRELQTSRVAERIVFVSRVGVGDTKGQGRKVSGLIQPFMPVMKRPLFDDLAAAEDLLRVSGLNALLLRATMLTDDPPGNPVVAVGPDEAPPHRISRASLADYILELLASPSFPAGELTVGTAK
jgi:uncharacterized protein YbjT (DUF2867 family)